MNSEIGAAARADVTTLLRDAILGGEFAPHQRLIEADLSERFGASRAAVRNALMSLAGDGLVERLPNRGARIRSISVEEAVEIVEVRLALEPMVARKAAENLDDEGVESLTTIRERMTSALDSGDLVEYSTLNRELDRSIHAVSGQRTASQILERLHAQSARHQFRLGFLPGRARKSGPEHLEIIDSILARDPERAERATRTHLSGVLALLRSMG